MIAKKISVSMFCVCFYLLTLVVQSGRSSRIWKTSGGAGCGQLVKALTRGYSNRMRTAACAVAYICVQVHAQSPLVAREMYWRQRECLHRSRSFKWLKRALVTTTTVNEDVLLCPRLHVITYRNVLIIKLNVCEKHPWRMCVVECTPLN